ncbi:MAG: hypothetical protein JOZ32_01320, partial [Bryobacterales bacterium]|nr:hypothetical protein [Bryobacterales bacterium]
MKISSLSAMKAITAGLMFTATLCGAPRLFYSKYFKGSVPEYVAITVERDG